MFNFKSILYKYNRLSKPIKASFWFIICYVIQRGLQFAGMPIYTRMMSIEDYGLYTVFLSWYNLICVISSLSIYSGVFNKAMVKYKEDKDQYISSIQYLTLLIGVVFSIFILLFNVEISKLTGFSLKLQLLMCVHLLSFPTIQYWSQKQRFAYEYKILVFVTLLNSILTLMFGVVFVSLLQDKGITLITVTVIVQAIINIILFISLSIKGNNRFYSKEYWSWSILVAIPLVPHYFSEILLGHVDRVMINQMCGPAQAGIYSIVYQISMLMTILRIGINGSFTPWLYQSLESNRYNSICKAIKFVSVVMASLTMLLILAGPEILKFAVPSSYYEAIIDFPAIMIGSYFIFIYVLFFNVEIYFEEGRYIAIVSISAALLNILLNYYGIQYFGYLIAGYTTMVSYMTMAVFHYVFLRKIMCKHSEIRFVFDFNFILIISIALLLLGISMIKLYQYFLLRLIIVIILFAIAYFKKREIISYLKGFNSI